MQKDLTMTEQMTLTKPEQIALNDGSAIPPLGLGVWQVDPAITAKVVSWGIQAGYRLIDTAEGYGNEEGVGQAIRTAGVPRGELFITSKLRNGAHQRDAALKAFDETMSKLGIKQIDLFLIHWPVPSQGKYVEAWKTLVELRQDGRIKSIGVSNFNQDHLERIIGETGVTPVVNQIELHPAVSTARHQGIPWQAQHPHRKLEPARQRPAVERSGPRRHRRQTSQVRGADDHQMAPSGRADRHSKVGPQERIAANFDVFDFELDAEDLELIKGLDSRDGRTGANPATAAFLF